MHIEGALRRYIYFQTGWPTHLIVLLCCTFWRLT